MVRAAGKVYPEPLIGNVRTRIDANLTRSQKTDARHSTSGKSREIG